MEKDADHRLQDADLQPHREGREGKYERAHF